MQTANAAIRNVPGTRLEGRRSLLLRLLDALAERDRAYRDRAALDALPPGRLEDMGIPRPEAGSDECIRQALLVRRLRDPSGW